MSDEIRSNISLLSTEEILQRIANSYYSAEGQLVAEEILTTRGVSSEQLERATSNASGSEEVEFYTETEFKNFWKSKLVKGNVFFLAMNIALAILNVLQSILSIRFGVLFWVGGTMISYFPARRMLWAMFNSQKSESIESKKKWAIILIVFLILLEGFLMSMLKNYGKN